jgi:murein lipoprotein
MSMSKVLLALTSASLLGLSGCSGLYVNQPGGAKDAATAPAALSADAQAALAAAQADVKDASSKFALWTTADAALKAAQEAAAKGDNATVIKQSKLASDHAKKGVAQLNYPMLKVGD